MSSELQERLTTWKLLVEGHLEGLLPPADTFPQPLFDAMRYSLFAGGKRIRPAFAFAAAEAVGGHDEQALPFAAAIEMIHTYSLIHDDLPAMDDDDLRRGKPTNHVLFGDGMAILAGDALLTDAFGVLTRPAVIERHGAAMVARAVSEIARAAGSHGMVAGQALDLASEGRQVDLPTLEFLHSHKTGALIRASVVVGGLAGGGTDEDLQALARYADRVGLAFQIADDLLDVESTTAELGKPVGSDQSLAKATYPAIVGAAEAKRLGAELMDAALTCLAPFGDRGRALASLARFVVERRN